MWSDMPATMINDSALLDKQHTNGSWHDYKINGIVYELLARSTWYLK